MKKLILIIPLVLAITFLNAQKTKLTIIDSKLSKKIKDTTFAFQALPFSNVAPYNSQQIQALYQLTTTPNSTTTLSPGMYCSGAFTMGTENAEVGCGYILLNPSSKICIRTKNQRNVTYLFDITANEAHAGVSLVIKIFKGQTANGAFISGSVIQNSNGHYVFALGCTDPDNIDYTILIVPAELRNLKNSIKSITINKVTSNN